MMQGSDRLTVCRLIFEFLPAIGGSIVHTIELSRYMHPYCRQYLIVPKSDVDTIQIDRSFPFVVYRVSYLAFKWLHHVKAKYLGWLPLSPLVVFSYGFFALLSLCRLNRQNPIDIIHAHGISVGIVATIAGRLLGKPVVWMLHGTEEPFNKCSGKYESIAAMLFRPDHILVLDDGTGAPEKFRRLLGGSRVSTVYHGIDTERFCPDANCKNTKTMMGLTDKFVFMYISRLIYWKNPEYAIRGFRRFLEIENSEDAVLLIIGEGEMRQQLETMVRDWGIISQVTFLGKVENSKIARYLSVSDVVLTTSLYSNLSRSTQEAMSCGKPVIAFNSGGTNKVIQHMKTGLLADRADVDDLAQKMRLLYHNSKLRKEIGDNARKFIVNNRSWESRVRVELAVYRRVIQKKK